jgi:hypothetical protein
VIELFVIGTAVIPTGVAADLAKPLLVLPSTDAPEAASAEGGE